VDDYLVSHVGSTAVIPTRTFGAVKIESASLTNAIDGDLVVQFGRPFEADRPVVRIHSECVLGEVLGTTLCDCAEQLAIALDRLANEGHGLLFYLRFDGRGAGLAAKVHATALEVQGYDTFESRVKIGVRPEGREFSPIARYLRSKGVNKVRLLTNNPDKSAALTKLGIEVEREALVSAHPNADVVRLYKTKAEKFGHYINPDLTGS
jgi:GTP cyclohydrolase II